MFVKKSLRNLLICSADLVEITLLEIFFLQPLPNCFFKVCHSTLFAAVLKILLPLKTSATYIAANSNKLAPTPFAAGTKHIYAKRGNCSSLKNLCKIAASPSTLSTNISIEWNLYLSWSNHLVTSFGLEMNAWSFSEHQNKSNDTNSYKGIFSALVSLRSMWVLWK